MNKKELTQEDWDNIKAKYKIGDLITGYVTRVEPFGVFLDVSELFSGLVLVPYISDKMNLDISEYPQIGDKVTGVVILLSEKLNPRKGEEFKLNYILISIKDLKDYPFDFSKKDNKSD